MRTAAMIAILAIPDGRVACIFFCSSSDSFGNPTGMALLRFSLVGFASPPFDGFAFLATSSEARADLVSSPLL